LGDPSESGDMQPDSRHRTDDMFAGRSTGPVTSIIGSTFAPAVATATLTPGIDATGEPASVITAGPAAANGTDVAHVHANGNGVHATNGYIATRLATWSTAMAATAGAGAAVASSTVLAAHLEPRGVYLRFGKRCIDVLGAAFALTLHLPLLVVAAIAIKFESRGPVFYRSTRIGKNGRPFTFLKLRSMVDGADRRRHHVVHLNEADGPVFKISNDPRVTRVGRFLRVTSIDEIPQFINVLRGEMSLVGPRPPLPHEVAQYEPWQLHRLDVLPGITCLWQISGRSRIGFQEWMRLDLEYIKHRSFLLDLKILFRTIPAVLSRDGAY
jgi:exopolysaccharide biosynthesis polyprenyl glycosylphosphotransferase